MERYLVTGGAGFIGSHLVETLLKEGHAVRVIDNLDTGSRSNLPADRIDFLEGSITDPALLGKAMEGVDFVYHEAARGSVPRSVEDPAGTHDANSTGTLRVLIAARDAGVKRVICASSSSVYGDTPTLPKVESMTPQPKSPYALSKLNLEQYCRMFTEIYGLETVALRYFNVYGPRQNPALQYAAVIPIFISRMLRNEPCVIYGDGEQTRDFTYVADCVKANLLARTSPASRGEAMNIACRDQISVNRLFSLLSELLNYTKPPVYEPARAGDVKHSFADIDRASHLLGYSPAQDLAGGLQKTIEWFRLKNR
jgi:nucleoside-diphosphate-sugar epimerase